MSADFDKAIDGAVREMLDLEPRADLRARVIAQLPASGSFVSSVASGSFLNSVASGFSRNRVVFGSFLHSVASGFSRNRVVFAAAAAAIVLAVLVLRRPEPLPQARVAAHGPDQHLPAEASPRNTRRATAAAPEIPSRRPIVVARASTNAEPRRIIAAVDETEDVNFSAVAAISAPRSLDVPRLQPPSSIVLPPFAPQPMTIRSLEVTALAETPRER